MKFKVGDEVVIIEDNRSPELGNGPGVVVSAIPEDMYPYRVTYPGVPLEEGELFKEQDLRKLTKLDRALK